MVKWSIIYSQIAVKHHASAPYVAQIHRGDRKAESPLARKIARSLARAEQAVKRMSKAVQTA